MNGPQPLNGETLLSLSQAAAKLPGHRGADRLHPATLTRWILAGVKARDGRRVKLEAARYGCRWLTSEAALARFAAALTPQDEATALPSARTPRVQRRASERAAEALIRRGA